MSSRLATAARATFSLPSLRRLVRGAVAIRNLRRQRQNLHDLDDHLLNDIGLGRREAFREAQRPIWDVPKNWRV
jgi:uncharacterized protein YjiS (DUF1127 family)